MIAPWVVYCVGLSALFCVAALGLEYAARVGRWPTRWVWLSAIVAVVTVPVALNELATPASPRLVRVQVSGVTLVPAIAPRFQDTNLDGPLLSLWLLASLAVIGRIAITVTRLHRSRARWDEVELDGEPVLLSAELGPAVIGFTHRRTVMPRWALEFDAASRALMLQHESEHARAGDPRLLAVAACALVVMPWNPVLWLLVRRLRLAIEVDCDTRVLASGANPRTYASLLVAVGERMAHTPFAWTIALATPRSFLERRIVALTSPLRPKYPRLTLAAIGAGVTLALAIACGTGHPDPVTIFSAAPLGMSPQVAADLKSGAYAKAGDTVVIEVSQRGPDGVRGREYTRGAVRSMQYLYGRPPLLLRYPDGYEVVVKKGTSFQRLLDDHTHDSPAARSGRPSSISPILSDGRICVAKAGHDSTGAHGEMINVGATSCADKKVGG